jgi:hypothetical protein
VVELRSAISVANMVRSMQSVLPNSIFMAGLWSLPSTGSARLNRKIREVVQGRVYTNMEQAVRGIVALMPPVGEDPGSEMKSSEKAK